ncbi:type II toxin-antitoxin system HicA family toxin [Anaerobaca lacustris]|uniref:Uncharacterized protein n=1 Tax=Anaerobaca lacustris TaxID=3044600 RepID=A0AAW6U0I2_9BACT|nr:hypothetical protein [Sedimentisphaerales bacterium M17dextr]
MPPVPVLKPREVVPNHAEVARGTLRSLIARAGLSVEEFLDAVGA